MGIISPKIVRVLRNALSGRGLTRGPLGCSEHGFGVSVRLLGSDSGTLGRQLLKVIGIVRHVPAGECLGVPGHGKGGEIFLQGVQAVPTD